MNFQAWLPRPLHEYCEVGVHDLRTRPVIIAFTDGAGGDIIEVGKGRPRAESEDIAQALRQAIRAHRRVLGLPVDDL